MPETPYVTMTLAIAENQSNLHVISVSGREALNEPYRFDIHLVTADLDVACDRWLQREAYLGFGPQADGFHGQIAEARRLYRGESLSLYHISLMPALQRLEQRTARRTFNRMSVPQIILRLLQDHGWPANRYRFDALRGVYPPREHCLQYDESDLHLLQRLCEEEGISFHFEHHQHRHVLVFADDPQAFAECPHASIVRARVSPWQTGIDYLAERFSIGTSYSSHSAESDSLTAATRPPTPASSDDQASSWAPFAQRSDMLTARQRQISGRRLERLRCERRRIFGRGNQPWLLSGRIMRVSDHTDLLLNDHWLLTEVIHLGKQLEVLEGSAPDDIQGVLETLNTATDVLDAAALGEPWPMRVEPLQDSGYRNCFKVLPWVMPYRPALRHPKPEFHSYHRAVWVDAEQDNKGRQRIRFDWQCSDIGTSGGDSWVAIGGVRHPGRLPAPLQVAFLNADPDQPYVCGPAAETGADTSMVRSIELDAGTERTASSHPLRLRPHEQLHIGSATTLKLRTTCATLTITPKGIDYSGPDLASLAVSSGRSKDWLSAKAASDLQLFHPDAPNTPLTHCVWYIVRLPSADLRHLPRIAAEAILFEGKTDEQGWLGLKPATFSRLLQLQHETPQQMFLVHPGHCRPLRNCFSDA